MSRRETDEEKLAESFKKREAEKAEEDKQAQKYFDKLDEIQQVQQTEADEDRENALATYKDLFVDEELLINVKGIEFKFRKNPTILEYEEMQSIKENDPDRKKKLIAYSYDLLISPEMPFEDYLRLPPYVIKYIEQKISEHFLMGLVSIVLGD